MLSCNLDGIEKVKDITSLKYHQDIEIEKQYNDIPGVNSEIPETNLEKIQAIEKEINIFSNKYYNIAPKEKEILGKDYTLKTLKVIEDTKCQWEFYAFETKNPKRKEYFEKYLMGCRFMYNKNKETDYMKIGANVVFKNNKDSIIYLTDKLFFQPIKGKKTYTKKLEKIKLIFPHKHLGPRDGCSMTIRFPEDLHNNIFRDKDQFYKVKKLIYDYSTGHLYLKLVTKTPDTLSEFFAPALNLIPKKKRKYKRKRFKDKEVLYIRTSVEEDPQLLETWLRSYDGGDIREITSPEAFLNEKETVRNKSKKYIYYTGTGLVLGVFIGGSAALSYTFFSPWSPALFVLALPARKFMYYIREKN